MSATATSAPNSSTPSRIGRIGRVIGWSLITTLKILFVMAIIALVLAGAYAIGVTVDQQTRLLQRRLALLEYESEQASSNHEAQAAEIAGLQSELVTVHTDMDTLATDLAADIAHQETMLTVLEQNLTAAIAQSDVISQNVSSLTTVGLALQGDITANTSSIDTLGGQTDGLQSDLTGIETTVGNLESSVATLDVTVAGLTDADLALEQFEQTLTLFRAWELLSRARLRLAEANFGLATADVADAQALLTTVAMPAAEGEEAGPLDSLQQRLTMVLTSLPDDPTTAIADLELAWEQLDAVMAGLLAVEEQASP